jgi:hypothetical protein
MSMTASEFAREVDRHFAFLQAMGFTRQLEDRGREWSIGFTKPEVAVFVTQEVGASPFVTLEDRSTRTGPEWWFRRGFGLHELVQEAVGPSASIPETLATQADALVRFGKTVLAGDFSVLHERSRRLGLAVEKNRAVPRA